MPNFAYRAISPTGEMLRGEIAASNRAGAVAHLHAEGAVPLHVSLSRPGWSTALSLDLAHFAKRHLSARDLADFIGRLATLVGAGVPIESAVTILGGAEGSPAAKNVIGNVSRQLRSGLRLADAMAAEGASFPTIVVSMVRAGEMSGGLATTLTQLGDYLRRTEEARQAIRSALIYPAILMAAAFGSVLIVFTAVLPALRPVVEGAGARLPILVRLSFGFSDLVRDDWWAFLLAVVACAITIHRVLTREAGRRRADALLLRLPLVKSAVVRADFSRFARTLGTLIGGGVAMPVALEAAQRVVVNRVLADAVATVAIAVREGSGLADPLAALGLFPDMAVQIVRIGEATAQVDRMLLQLAEIMDQDVRRDLARALALLVPMLTVGLGLLVAGIVASVMLAVLSINDLAQ